MAAQAPSRDKADAALARLLDLFESDCLPQAIARSTIARLDSDAPSAAWSLGNRLLMLLNGTDDARGFRQWEAAGRNVRKGSKAFHILGPCTRKITETDEYGNETERVAVVGFKGIPVFALEDTDGEPVADRPDYTPAQMPPLFDVAERLGVTVRWLPFSDRYYGYFSPQRDEIVLCTDDWSTYFHELAHAAHCKVKGGLKGGQDATQEIVAEVTAAVLAQLYGMDLGIVTAARDYIRHYAKRDGAAKAAVRVIAEVEKVLDLILEPVAAEPVAITARPKPLTSRGDAAKPASAGRAFQPARRQA